MELDRGIRSSFRKHKRRIVRHIKKAFAIKNTCNETIKKHYFASSPLLCQFVTDPRSTGD